MNSELSDSFCVLEAAGLGPTSALTLTDFCRRLKPLGVSVLSVIQILLTYPK